VTVKVANEASVVGFAVIMAMAGVSVFSGSGSNCFLEKCIHFRLGLRHETNVNTIASGRCSAINWCLNLEFGECLVAKACGTGFFQDDPAPHSAQHFFIEPASFEEAIGPE